jgi:serine/threonine-protein kinase RsbT
VGPERLPVRSADDVIRARHRIREVAQDVGLRLVDQTKLVTAVSELARNTLIHGGGGEMTFGVSDAGSGVGVWAEFSDAGPGIADVDQALRDGVSNGDGLGLGLGGARRLVHEFDIRTAAGEGTKVRIVTWR